MMQIAIQGQLGSFHHQAASILRGEHVDIVPYVHFKDVFAAVTSGHATHGLAAIENNLYGSINETYRLLNEHNVWIEADLRMQIHQCLIGAAPTTVAQLARLPHLEVISQAPALAQVDRWLEAHLPHAIREERTDTAASVQEVMQNGSPNMVAIAGRQAARLHNANILAADIEDEPHNYTRFVLFSARRHTVTNATTSSIILTTDHRPGALVRALQLFDKAAINLSKVDSHPTPGNAQHYDFYIDFDSPAESAPATAILTSLEQQGNAVKLLGSYVRHIA